MIRASLVVLLCIVCFTGCNHVSKQNLDSLVAARIKIESSMESFKAAEMRADEASKALATASEADKQSIQKKYDDAVAELQALEKDKDEAFKTHWELTHSASRSTHPVIPLVIFGTLGVIVLVIIAKAFDNHDPTTALDVNHARGVITFLVATITVCVALILVLSTVLSESPDRAERFQDGKDVLTTMIGVLGTIVGFYFGQRTKGELISARPLGEGSPQPKPAAEQDKPKGPKGSKAAT